MAGRAVSARRECGRFRPTPAAAEAVKNWRRFMGSERGFMTENGT
jgi:hypothetical protein